MTAKTFGLSSDDNPLRMIYCYAPAGDVAYWRQELRGPLPKAGIDVPPLPQGCAVAAHAYVGH